MNDLSQLLGGGQQQSEFQDFVNRFQQGPPEQGYSDQEAVQRYQQIAPKLPEQEYQASATQAFEQLSPQQRMQLGQQLIQSAQQKGIELPQQQPNAYQDPNALAQAVTQVHRQQPGLLPQLLSAAGGGGAGGGLGGALGSLLGGGNSGAQAQSAGQARSGGGGMLSSPVAKIALAGIAAMAAQRMMGRR